MSKKKKSTPPEASVPSHHEPAFDPLHSENIGEMIRVRLLGRELLPLDAASTINGAGIYTLYYAGNFEPYAPLVASNSDEVLNPIYVGKAIPRGGRKGLKDLAAPSARENALSRRIDLHFKKLSGVEGVKAADFRFRYLPLTPVWIALGENALIRWFKPLWNIAVDGFGNNALGAGRLNQSVSSWDVLHPRTGAEVVPAKDALPAKVTREAVLERVRDYFKDPESAAASSEVDEAELSELEAAQEVIDAYEIRSI
jgi:hypothetical protein